jgi:hypothetical protein
VDSVLSTTLDTPGFEMKLGFHCALA